jgi:exodeoxyribonuclease VII small subunit
MKGSVKLTESNKTINFEKKINALEKIVDDMEKGSLSLEDSLKFFEDGIKITRECQQALKDAELKVETLTSIKLNGKRKFCQFLKALPTKS